MSFTPDANMLDAFWERTEAVLTRSAGFEEEEGPMDEDGDLEDDAQPKALSPAPAALAAAKTQAIAAAGRLVAFQV